MGPMIAQVGNGHVSLICSAWLPVTRGGSQLDSILVTAKVGAAGSDGGCLSHGKGHRAKRSCFSSSPSARKSYQ